MTAFMIQTPVVFLPGFLCDERLWFAMWKQMTIQDRRYVPLQWANSLEEMLSLTEHAVNGDKVHLIGFSMGGYIASQFALANPELVASLNLISYCSDGLGDAEVKQRQGIIKAINQGKYQAMSQSRLDRFIYPESDSCEFATDMVKSMEADLGANVVKCQIEATTPRKDLTQALADASFPLNIAVGEQDQVSTLVDIKAVHQRFGRGELLVLEDAGHMLPLEQVENLASGLRDWLGD